VTRRESILYFERFAARSTALRGSSHIKGRSTANKEALSGEQLRNLARRHSSGQGGGGGTCDCEGSERESRSAIIVGDCLCSEMLSRRVSSLRPSIGQGTPCTRRTSGASLTASQRNEVANAAREQVRARSP
jgi:hypothetical protein